MHVTDAPGVADGLRALIRDVPDFPEPGIIFKDITPILADARAFSSMVDALTAAVAPWEPDAIVGVEARGFVLAAPVAASLGVGFVPVRKQGKLPWKTHAESYALEYGTATLEIHEDALAPGARIAIVDDVLATGGTAAATARLVEALGARVAGLAFLIELSFLAGRDALPGRDIAATLTY